MKKWIVYLFFSFTILPACEKKDIQLQESPKEIEPPILRPVTNQVNDQVKGFYEAIPESYSRSSDRFPAMIFIHGAGQFGNGKNDLPMLLQEGITQLLDEKKIPASFSVKGSNHSMIYFSPQFSSEFSIPALYQFIQFIKSTYRIDSSRLYIAGISRGAELACRYASVYPTSVAAVISMAGGIPPDSQELSAKSLAFNEVPIWAIHNTGDELIPAANSEKLLELIHQFNGTSPALLTLLSPEGALNHDCWTRSTNPEFRVNNLNIYEWALQFQK